MNSTVVSEHCFNNQVGMRSRWHCLSGRWRRIRITSAVETDKKVGSWWAVKDYTGSFAPWQRMLSMVHQSFHGADLWELTVYVQNSARLEESTLRYDLSLSCHWLCSVDQSSIVFSFLNGLSSHLTCFFSLRHVESNHRLNDLLRMVTNSDGTWESRVLTITSV